ncbi:hypothetical protein MASR2M69_01900 [Bacteroidota bacterium]
MESPIIVTLEKVTKIFPAGKNDFTALNKVDLVFRKGNLPVW